MSAATIAAIATPPGRSALAVVRVSGTDAPRIGMALVAAPLPAPRTARYCAFRDAAGNTLDRGIMLYFKAPASATGEDVLELHGHGGSTVPQMVLERVLELGARPARPGEFSERAFLNGKLDLAQAEAVADLIDSQTRAAARGALRSMEGGLSTQARALAVELLGARAQLEAAIDFPEDIEADAGVSDTQLARLLAAAMDLRERARQGELLGGGLRAVIAGPVNAGKSTLLNALAGAELAIVDAAPGTTRDPVRTTLDLDGLPLLLTDTAGLRAAPEPVEAEGIRRARAHASQADLVLLVQEYGTPAVSLPGRQAVLRIHNKIDLHGIVARADGDDVYLSARTGDGLELLRAAILERAGRRPAEGACTARRRHVAALERCHEHLLQARELWSSKRAAELSAEELALAGRALDELTGATTTEALLGEIFSSFCIGK